MSKPILYDASSLFHKFEKELAISDKTDQLLRDAQKEIRFAIQSGFRANFEKFLRTQTGISDGMLRVASQLSEEKVKFLPQGSYVYGTLNKPQHVPPQEMDLDYGVYFRVSDIDQGMGLNPKLLFFYIKKQLEPLVDSKGWRVKEKSTCVRLVIGGDKHVDVPLYIVPDEEFSAFEEKRAAFLQQGQYAGMSAWDMPFGLENIMLAHRDKGWIASDPRKINQWVAGCKKRYNWYKTLCRIIKAWRDCQWENSPLSSICIMRMVEMALESMGAQSDRLDIVLTNTIREIHRIISANQPVTNPYNGDSLNANIDVAENNVIAQKLGELFFVMEYVIYNEGEQANKNKKLKDQFGKFFPLDFSKISRCAKTAAAVTSSATTVTAARAYASENDPHVGAVYRAIEDKEKKWLEENQPLLFIEPNNVIRGTFRLRGELRNEKERKVDIFSLTPPSPGEFYIEDTYKISFGLSVADNLPHAWELENKILNQLKQHGINNLLDAHIYPASKMLCLATVGDLLAKVQKNPSLSCIVKEIIAPYFYYHSYWAKFGEEPWPGLPHGDIGLLENFYEQCGEILDPLHWFRKLTPMMRDYMILKPRIKNNDICICRRRIKAKNCRCKAVGGYNLLRKELQQRYPNEVAGRKAFLTQRIIQQ